MAKRDTHLRMMEWTVPAAVAGITPEAIAQLATEKIWEELSTGAISVPVAFTFRGRAGRIWQLFDVDPVDDVIRCLAQREEAQAVVVIRPAPVPRDAGGGDRAVEVAAESGWGRYHEVCLFKQTSEGIMCRRGHLRPEPEQFRWFGIKPKGEIKLWLEGIIGLTGRGRPPDDENKPS